MNLSNDLYQTLNEFNQKTIKIKRLRTLKSKFQQTLKFS